MKRQLSPDEIKRRITKFKRRAHLIVDQEHFDAILASFPLDMQAEIYLEVHIHVKRFKPVLSEPKDRIPFNASKEVVREIKDIRAKEEAERKRKEKEEDDKKKISKN